VAIALLNSMAVESYDRLVQDLFPGGLIYTPGRNDLTTHGFYPAELALFFIVHGSIRWIEWAAVVFFAAPVPGRGYWRRFSEVILPSRRVESRWILAGVILSLLLDLLFFRGHPAVFAGLC
jgi:hypothetical protein